MTSTATLAVVWRGAKAQSVEAAKTTEMIIASTIASNSSSFIPLALNDLVGTKFRLIAGYQGSPPMALAMERGEVDAIAGMSWEAIQTVKRDWLDENKVGFLYTLGARRIRDLPDVPCLPDFASDDRSRGILRLLGSGQEIGRSLVAEPGAPPERIAALREAFDATMADPAYIADATARNLTVDPLPGREVARIVAETAATPRDIIDAARKYFGQ